MLRTNNKKVIEKVKEYILEHFKEFYLVDNKDYIEETLKTDESIFEYIVKTIKNEKSNDIKRNYNFLTFAIFEDYCRGLPNILCCEYYYNVSAVNLVAEWLEENEEEKAKYNERQAEKLATTLLYKVLIKYNQ